MTEDHVEMSVMGRIIGTATGWDMQDTFSILLYDLELNELGCRFVSDFIGPRDLAVDFERGVAAIYDDEGNETILTADWSVFNR